MFFSYKRMLKIFIQGKADGKHNFELKESASCLNSQLIDFVEFVTVVGEFKKLGDRFTINAKIDAFAKLLCDVSFEEFLEPISTNVEISAYLYEREKNQDLEENENELFISAEDKWIDITEIVYQELVLAVPMKRIAPKYRDKDFAEIFPDIAANIKTTEEPSDERWSVLKNIKIN